MAENWAMFSKVRGKWAFKGLTEFEELTMEFTESELESGEVQAVAVIYLPDHTDVSTQ